MQKSSLQYFNSGMRTDPLGEQKFTKIRKLAMFANSLLAQVRGNRLPGAVQRHTACAYQIFTATSSGDFTITINGVDTVTSFDTSATITASAAVTALNALTADALCYGGRTIEADNRKATYTLTSTAAGTVLTIGGIPLTAVQKAADGPHQWEVSGSDTADAAALVVAINTHPSLKDLVCADNSSGVVTIRSRRASTPARDLVLKASAEVLSGTILAASSVVCVSSVQKGVPGNWITTAVAGTGSAVGGARMTGGTTVYEVV